MAERLRTIVRIIGSELDKRKVNALKKAVTVMENAGGTIQSTLNAAASTLSSKHEVVAKRIYGETMIFQDSETKRIENAGENVAWTAGIVRWWDWYQRLVGMDRLEMCKQRVDSAQERLFRYQEERRHLNRVATVQNEKLKEVYAELLQTKRDDPRYVQLTILENKSLQDLRKVVGRLNLLEKEERDHFTLLATAIKEYHVTQDLCAQKYKYISIVASVSLAVLSLVATNIYNKKRTESGRIMLSESLDQNKLALATTIRSIDEYLNVHFSQIQNKLAEMSKERDMQPTNDSPDKTTSTRKLKMDETYVVIGLGIFAVFFLKAVLG